MPNKPYVSLCIPTNGVIYLLAPVLETIYSQGVSEDKFEIIITDNGNNLDFRKYIQEEIKKHTNIFYYKTEASAFINEIESYKRANGIFIKFINHRTLLTKNSLEYLIDFVINNLEKKPAIYFLNGNGNFKKPKTTKKFDKFIRKLGLYSTASTGMAFWKEDFDNLDLSKCNELFPHDNILFGINNKQTYIIDNQTLLKEIEIGHGHKGKYDLFYAFGVDFLNLEKELLDNGFITKLTFKRVKKEILDFMCRCYIDFVLLKKPASYDLSSFDKSMSVYFKKSEIRCRIRYIKFGRFIKKCLRKIKALFELKKYSNEHFIFDKPYKVTIKNIVKNLLYKSRAKKYKKLISEHFKTSHIVYKKYYVSICGIFKNEAPYLKEWIEYHLMMGIDHIFLYNNNSEDNFLDIIKPYIDENKVTLIQWEKNQAQMEAYQDCINRFKDKTNWLGFIDIDEFIVPKNGVTIKDFLKQNESRCGSLMIYWKFFGSGGFDNRDISKPVTKDFLYCWPKYTNIGKCFFNTDFDFDPSKSSHSFLHHEFWAQEKNKEIPPMNTSGNLVFFGKHEIDSNDESLQINHYFTKSKHEYIFKKTKGDVYFKVNPHDDEYFKYHNEKCSAIDERIQQYLPSLIERLK